jgi:D-alanine-D-alanine ligase
MKVAVVYNRDSKSVINLFGLPSREKIGLKTIRRLVAALRQGDTKSFRSRATKISLIA